MSWKAGKKNIGIAGFDIVFSIDVKIAFINIRIGLPLLDTPLMMVLSAFLFFVGIGIIGSPML